jgi:hypothetical protein
MGDNTLCKLLLRMGWLRSIPGASFLVSGARGKAPAVNCSSTSRSRRVSGSRPGKCSASILEPEFAALRRTWASIASFVTVTVHSIDRLRPLRHHAARPASAHPHHVPSAAMAARAPSLEIATIITVTVHLTLGAARRLRSGTTVEPALRSANNIPPAPASR